MARILAKLSLLAIGYEAITETVLDLGELGLAGDTLVVVNLTDRTVAVQGEVNIGELLGIAEKGLPQPPRPIREASMRSPSAARRVPMVRKARAKSVPVSTLERLSNNRLIVLSFAEALRDVDTSPPTKSPGGNRSAERNGRGQGLLFRRGRRGRSYLDRIRKPSTSLTFPGRSCESSAASVPESRPRRISLARG